MKPLHFRFYLGSPALNFSATKAFRRGVPLERVSAAADLARWLAEARLVPAGTTVTPAEYRDAIALREAIFAVGDALVGGRKPSAVAVGRINSAARAAPAVAQMNPRSLARETHARSPVRAALAAIAGDAIEQFTTNRARLGACEGAECSALTVSHSRGAARRWCSMQSCGNRAKVAAYRARATSL